MDNDTHLKKRKLVSNASNSGSSTPNNTTSNSNNNKLDDYDIALFDWLSHRRRNLILSIDCPSGYSFDQGVLLIIFKLLSIVTVYIYIYLFYCVTGPRISNPVSPDYTIALGAIKNPSPDTTLRQISPQVAIADIGLPNVCFERVGASKWSSPFNTQWVTQITS